MQIRAYAQMHKNRTMPDIPIVLATRFNLYSPTRGQQPEKYASDLGTQEAWTAERVDAFLAYCLPSITRQTVKPDRWYVMFDDIDRDPVAGLIQRLQEYEWITPLFVERRYGFTNFLIPLEARIKRDFPDASHVITCRLDSDDSLNVCYFATLEATIKEYGIPENPTMFNFTMGLIQEEGRYHVFPNEKSPFLTGIERLDAEKFISPYRGNHKLIDNHAAVVEVITERPMWCQHMHGANIGKLDTYRYMLTGNFHELANLFNLQPMFPKPKPPRRKSPNRQRLDRFLDAPIPTLKKAPAKLFSKLRK